MTRSPRRILNVVKLTRIYNSGPAQCHTRELRQRSIGHDRSDRGCLSRRGNQRVAEVADDRGSTPDSRTAGPPSGASGLMRPEPSFGPPWHGVTGMFGGSRMAPPDRRPDTGHSRDGKRHRPSRHYALSGARGSRPIKATRRSQSSAPDGSGTSSPYGDPSSTMSRYSGLIMARAPSSAVTATEGSNPSI